MSGNFKFILGVAIGASVGAAVGYALSSGKKEEWFDVLEEKVSKVKEDLEVVADKINNSVQAIVARA